MSTATIHKTKNYLVIKIPLQTVSKRERVPLSGLDKKAVEEGLKAIAKGRVSRGFKTAKEAVAFLRSI